MSQRHLIVMDPIKALDFSLDTSLRMGKALADRGSKVMMATIDNFQWQSPSEFPHVEARELKFGKSLNKLRLGDPEVTPLVDFSGIHMRKDPPFDLDYITTTWFLDTVRHRVKIFNDPTGLRSVNEKLAILAFPDAIAPTLVSADNNEIMRFLRQEGDGDIVVKPLNLYGGKGIERISLEKLKLAGAKRKISALTRKGKEIRMIQPFNKDIYKGEVRCFTIGGNVLGTCLKMPKKGQYLANSSFGSTRHPYELNSTERNRVETAARSLLKFGISVIGFDLIGGLISEINVTSPRLLTAEKDQSAYFEKFADWILIECQP